MYKRQQVERCAKIYVLNLSVTFLCLNQADGLCAEDFCQSPVFHLHCAQSDSRVQKLAEQFTKRRRLFPDGGTSIPQQNEGKHNLLQTRLIKFEAHRGHICRFLSATHLLNIVAPQQTVSPFDHCRAAYLTK